MNLNEMRRKIDEHWDRGAKGTGEVPLEPGVNFIFRGAEKAVAFKEPLTKEQNIDEIVK